MLNFQGTYARWAKFFRLRQPKCARTVRSALESLENRSVPTTTANSRRAPPRAAAVGRD